MPLLLFANYVSDAVCGREAGELNLHGMAQSSRKLWLARPGDVLVTQFPVSAEFRRYACGLLSVDPESVMVLSAEPDPALPLAEAVARAGLTGRLRALVAARPGIELLPIVLDRPTVRLAAELGIPVQGYGTVPESALEAVDRLNTKTGFRTAAQRLGIRVPDGLSCANGAELDQRAAELLERHPRVLVKPARAAGGHALRVLTRAELPELPGHRAAAGPQREGWVVEEYVPFVRDVSVQMAVGPAGAEVVYSGEMRTRDGSYHGFAAPLPEADDAVRKELEGTGVAFGDHLARLGYRGRFSVDAGIAADSSVYAVESNVRRTATTTRHAMVRRLAALSGLRDPAWLTDTRPGDPAAAGRLLGAAGLAYSRERGEGVVLSVESDASGWHYAVIAADPGRAAEIERNLLALPVS